MSRIKNYYFNDFDLHRIDSDIYNSIVDDFIEEQKIKLPTNSELKEIGKTIKNQKAEDYIELINNI